MVDISIEILASSVPLESGQSFRYRIKTWWTHIDVPPEKTVVKLPRLPMIQQYLIMTGKDTTIFVETWFEERDSDAHNIKRPKFIGMTVCCVDEQLKNPCLNPSVQWLDVRDPVENIQKGKLLLKLDAKFALPDKTQQSDMSEGSQCGTTSQFVSPQRTMAANFPQNSNPGLSAQSEASGASATSAWCNLQEQAVQTDLSFFGLPLTNIPVLHSSTSGERECSSHRKNNFTTQQRRSMYKSTKSASGTSPSIVIDPLEIAQDIMRRNFTGNIDKDSTNDTLTFQGSRNCRRSCISKQNSTMSKSDNKPGVSDANKYDLESMGHVIDILNPKGKDDNLYPHPEFLYQTKPPQSNSTRNDTNNSTGTNFRSLDMTKVRLAPEGSSAMNKEVKQSGNRSNPKIEKHSSVVSDPNNTAFRMQRFKEVHFDGTRAQEQAAALVNMGRPSTEVNAALSRTNSLPPLPVTRRRIAAAIFDN